MKTIYLAGPDVFFRDAAARYDHLRALCAAHGLRGVAPVDGAPLPPNLDKAAQAEHIYRANMALLQGADAVLANVMAFRNPVEPDSGTVFEIGAAVALGKPVALYHPQLGRSLAERVREAFSSSGDEGGAEYDATYGLLIEDFGQPLNLMLARSCSMHASVQEAVAALARVLGAGQG
ncbi:nucleoside 2-deoxyribosyltransferase [Azohydromonas caseinilytica]|uniref:Nucleoside 2-deoxyribosyltransferase n=1 Tax=Azohydromonas caseinilytica TaxID=2728836 RepID=A0A848F6X5_9BURK|nr:nucleoside 2-deoxyribosyltransferase [Azohydromonas caseinilytica]NML13831.1 nucleoside 2-deoxyribosyltransferase [Azohydromonas caseinilytica]